MEEDDLATLQIRNVPFAARKQFLGLKKRWGLRTGAEVIQALLQKTQRGRSSVGAVVGRDVAEVVGSEGEDKQKTMCLSYEGLRERQSDMAFLTGLKPRQFQWFWVHFLPLVVSFFFLLCRSSVSRSISQPYRTQVSAEFFGKEGGAAKKGRKPKKRAEDVFVMFFSWLRQGFSYRLVGLLFGSSSSRAHVALHKVLRIFSGSFSGRLFFFHHVREVDAHVPERFKADFPHVKLIGDGWPIVAKGSAIFLIQKLEWSQYKHGTVFSVVICKSSSGYLS